MNKAIEKRIKEIVNKDETIDIRIKGETRQGMSASALKMANYILKDKKEYYNGDCDFYHDCISGEDVGGNGGCLGCTHNLEEEWR